MSNHARSIGHERTGATWRLSRLVVLGGALSVVMSGGQALADSSTPVTCGDTITAPGHYYLAADCATPPGTDGINIEASNVRLDLAGHTMTGSGWTGVQAIGVSGFDLEGPGVVSTYTFGISLDNVSGSHIARVTATNSDKYGFDIFNSRADSFTSDVAVAGGEGIIIEAGSTGIHLENVTSSDNFSAGVEVANSSGNYINGSTVDGNQGYGIALGPGATANHVNGNTVLGNVLDMADFNPGCDSNVWAGNRFNTADQPCIS